jgi:hypothetical protein
MYKVFKENKIIIIVKFIRTKVNKGYENIFTERNIKLFRNKEMEVYIMLID